MIQNAGTQVIVSGTDAAVGVSGRPTRVFSINILMFKKTERSA